MNYIYDTYPKAKDIIFKAIGLVLALITLCLVFVLFYTNFFERELYLNRKKLYKYLLKHPISGAGNRWKIGKYELVYLDKKTFSFFDDNDCLMCSFHAGIVDSYYYNKILAMIEKVNK